MNRAKLRKAGWIERIAVMGALAGASMSAGAFMGPGGTIYFKGALVAPPFSIAAASAAGSNFATGSYGLTGDSAQVVFTAPVYSSPSAHVSVDAGRAAAPAISFEDGLGRRIAPSAAGEYHVGASGGILSMKGASVATIVTTYD
jgi:hypothetical protein